MDGQQNAERLDAFDDECEDLELDEMPPHSMWGAEAYGAGGTETEDSVIARSAREEPDRFRADEEIAEGLFVEDEVLEDEAVAVEGDERGRPSAEEAAVHVLDEDDAIRRAGLDPDGPPGDGYIE